MKIKHSAANSQ